MASHGVIVLNSVAAEDVKSYNRSVLCSGSDIDNGNVFFLNTQGASGSGAGEVWNVDGAPSGSKLVDMWMAYSPEIPITTEGDLQYRGLHADPVRFTNIAGKVFDAFLPRIGDVITASSPVFANAISSYTYANAADGVTQLTFGSTQSGSALSFKVLDGNSYISRANGGINNQRITAYKLVCIATGYGK
jgi:hypothetical protein